MIQANVQASPQVTASSSGDGVTATVSSGQVSATVTSGIGPQGASDWSSIVGKPSDFPPSQHTHDDRYYTETEVDSLLTGKQEAGSYIITTDSRLSDARVPLAHQHTASQISDFTTAVIAASPPTTDASLLSQGILPDERLSSAIARASDVTAAVANSLAGKVDVSDSRLTDSREWSADTITQAEAEGGTSTTRRAFSSLRVFQGIAAWWAGSAAKAKLDGVATGATANSTDAQLRDRSTHTGTQTSTTISDFASAVADASPAEVLYYATVSQFPATGSASKIYVATDESRAYQWSGSQWVEIGPAGVYLPVHEHAAGDVTSGVFNVSRIPSLPASQIGSGTLSDSLLSSAIARASDVSTALAGKAALVHAHGNINNDGTLAGAVVGGGASPVHNPLVVTNSSGVIVPAATIAASAVSGLATVATSGSYNDLTDKPTNTSGYTLPVATASVLGGVKQGANITIDGDGVISAATVASADNSLMNALIFG